MGHRKSFLLLGLALICCHRLVQAEDLPEDRVAITGLRIPSELPLSGYGLAHAFGDLTFTNPVAIVSPPGETNRLFIAERGGRILVLTNLAKPSPHLFLDLRSKTYPNLLETGLLGLAFHPGYASNGFFYVFRTLVRTTEGNTNTVHDQVSRFQVSPLDRNQALENSEVALIAQVDDAFEHNAGDLKFGPDGYLYISFGDIAPPLKDRSSQRQPIDNGFFGAIGRIDVDHRPGSLAPNPHPASVGPYWIPPDNPFIGTMEHLGVRVDPAQVRTEFYAIGFRNPWRMCFDPITGDLICGDVGDTQAEEINLVQKGGNYGWPYLEGNLGEAPPDITAIPPALSYPHGYGGQEGMAVIGGVVYTGTTRRDLSGAYVFGDYGSGSIWSVRFNQGTAPVRRYLTAERGISAFGIDPSNGDVLVANHTTGTIKRLIFVAPEEVASLPKTLRETGIFSDLQTLTPIRGVIPYSVNVPFWSDQALKSRWFGLPNTDAEIKFNALGNWEFPAGAFWVKHFDLQLTNGASASTRRLETRLLVKTRDGVYGLTYRWGTSLTNAILVPEEGLDEDFILRDGESVRSFTWHYPSRTQCQFCHTREAGFALGFNTAQLNCRFGPNDARNQIDYLRTAGYFKNPPTSNSRNLPALAPSGATSTPLGHRARSYLSANCSQCHQPGAPAGATWDARLTTPLPLARIVDAPVSYFNGLEGAANRVIAPRSTEHSMIYQWMSWRGVLQMPPTGTSLVDTNGLQLLADWINSFPPEPWRDSTIGPTNIQGYTSVQDGRFTVSATVTDGVASTNSVYFLSLPVDREGQLIVRLSEFRSASSNCAAGVMIRAGTDSHAAFLAVVQSGSGLPFMQRRTKPGGPIESRSLGATIPNPWIRIARQDLNLIAYTSNDGERWTVVGTLPILGNPNIVAGLAVTPSQPSMFTTATFTDVRFVSAAIKEPRASETFTSSKSIPLVLDVASINNSPLRVEFLAGLEKLGEVTSSPYVFLWQKPNAGKYQIRARITDARGVSMLTSPVEVNILPGNALAKFRYTDTATRGNWRGVYGTEGYLIPGGAQAFPSTIKVLESSLSTVVWSRGTNDERALQLISTPTRIGSGWTAPKTLSLTVQLDDAQLHQLALYFANWDGPPQRTALVELFELSSGTLLDAHTIDSFSNGKYLVWSARGQIRIQITTLNDSPAILNAVFIDPLFNRLPAVSLATLPDKLRLPAQIPLQAEASDPDGTISRVEFWDSTELIGAVDTPPYALGWSLGTVGIHRIFARAVDDLGGYSDSALEQLELERAPAAAEFIGIDDVTGGNWKGDYRGFAIAGVLTNYPSNVSVEFQFANSLIWSQYLNARQALEDPINGFRTASTWYGNEIKVRVDFNDGLWHRLALYFLDWDSGGRIEGLTLRDPITDAVLDRRVISGFGSGQYYLWDVQGSILFDIVPANMNAVLSALFFDPLGSLQALGSVELGITPAGVTSPAALVLVRGPPGQTVQFHFSTDLEEWMPAANHIIPINGLLTLPRVFQTNSLSGFYKAELLPDKIRPTD